MKRISLAFLILLSACQTAPAPQQLSTYPDLKSYFQAEIGRLKQQNPSVRKSVQLNQQQEVRTISGINWEQELALFTESDINKSAYLGLYQLKKVGGAAIYSTTDEELRTRWIKIIRDKQDRILLIAINNRSKNSLYTANELLEYYPDSLYRIKKQQKTILSETYNYWIEGKFTK